MKTKKGSLVAVKSVEKMLVEQIKSWLELTPDPGSEELPVSAQLIEECDALEAIFGTSYSSQPLQNYLMQGVPEFEQISPFANFQVIKLNASYSCGGEVILDENVYY